MDYRLKNLANILVNYSLRVKPGQWVIINANAIATPLINEVARAILEAGGNYNVMMSSDDLNETYYRHANDAQIQWISPVESLIYEKADATISILAATNTRALTGTDPKKQAARGIARRALTQQFMERSARRTLAWSVVQFPCPAFAQEADMSLSDYENFVYGACYADQDDPVAKWQAVQNEQQKLVDWLKGKDRVEVRGPNIDLTLSIRERTFLNACGDRNMPDGEIFTGPVEESVNGWVRFSYPALRGGMEVDGVEFKFENGKVTEAKAKKNQDYLLTQLDSDAGSRYLGEFAIGTNFGIQKFTKNILFDEKIGGTLHMAVGAGYPETGSKNLSAVHWDFICDMRHESEVRVDGELFYKNGAFQV
ncbi:MAG TPA: aminopeptidase [Anaerolineales bacterium]|nr:aminopeptidase [Anaerolineales bacterium]